MPALTSRLVAQAALQHWAKLVSRAASSTAVATYQPTGEAAVKWNPQLDRTKPDYTTPLDKKTLDAKIEFYTKMKDPREDLVPITKYTINTKFGKPPGNLWDLWGTYYIPEDRMQRWPEDWKEYPERDLVNYPQPVMQDFSPKTRLGGIIPDSFFQFFYEKTGVTGPYLLLGGFSALAMQKEWIIWDHNFKRFFAYLLMLPFFYVFAHRIWLPYLDNINSNEINQSRNTVRTTVANLRDNIFAVQAQRDFMRIYNSEVFVAKAENVDMQLEAEYRNRLKNVHSEVKKRLDYMVEIDSARRRFQHKHMVEWIVAEVKKAITPQLEKAIMQQCLADLKQLTKNV